MMRPVLTLTLVLACLVVLSVPVAAQGHSGGAEIKKQMDEISRLMRESERLLLEMTRIDRLVEQQRQLVRELEKLKTPKEQQPDSSADAEADPKKAEQQKAEREKAEQAKRRELQEKQGELRRKLEELFRNQDAASSMSVKRLEQLLRNLPSSGGGGGGGGQKPQQPKPGDKEKKNKEQKQNEPKDGKEKREEKPGEKKPSGDQKKSEEQKKNAQSQIARIEAWMARLPPAQQERISRNDFSGFPPRYRRLLREYTRLRAKREAETEREER